MKKEEEEIASVCVIGMAIILIAVSLPIANAKAEGTNNEITYSWLWSSPTMICNGSIADCQAEEFLMDSEINRRFLQDGKSIGYPALNPDRPICNPGPGRSYGGNCLPSRSNPPSRGCNPYDHCRGGH